jgi:hypothetical protein
MMLYLRIKPDGSIEYPYAPAKLKYDFPSVSFPQEKNLALLAEYGVYPVTRVAAPEQTLTQDPAEQPPQQMNGVWTQVWAMVNISPEIAAKRQQLAADEADLAAVRADAFVQNFIAMTPAQVSAYVDANTANTAQVRALLNKMALMLLALARREYR